MEDEQSTQQSVPLLEKASTAGGVVYFDGCPGCAVDRRKAENPGIPYGNFLYVWIVTLCTGTPSFASIQSQSWLAMSEIAANCRSLCLIIPSRALSSRRCKLRTMVRDSSVPMAEEATSPLLKQEYHPGCPGCAYDQKKQHQSGMPYKEFLYVWMICLTAALPISSLFPFLYFMIRDLHVAKRTEDIGFYAGFVGASFMFGRCLTSTAWGIAADRIGRKPVIVFGIFSVVVFNTLFGLSVSYWMAIATRFLLGALNGLLGPIKAYAIEVCRPEHEALALSLVSTAWGIGLIIGPALGGYLALPAEKFPNVFSPDSLFARFPYFLPCLCTSVFAAAVLISCIWMPETLHKHQVSETGNQSIEALEAPLTDPKEKVESDPVYTYLVCLPLYDIPVRTRLSIILNIASVIKNNLSPQDQRGAANGLSMTAMSLFKAIAPAGAGIVFSWAQKRQHAYFFPGDQMVFLLLNVIELIGLILTFKPFLAVPERHDGN
ncbi:hypothetical protein PR202_ga24865 [Eleusine coracana subsp. coracana]|uniref:Major facilitator superfamily (MFS) profile domain-containing protein n=1 Tax=Eleusine coracana subsp. coracana TaxID=191504 RepID=A0AAV5DA74_ELECO|nr:hypothetical protein PR202_ga24865 [Eleusine coracana subsp. coracana]